MKKNMGSADITARIAVAVAIALLYVTHTITGGWSIVLPLLGAALLITSIIGYCPLYTFFGINTCRRKA
jgi:hypothetical protein